MCNNIYRKLSYKNEESGVNELESVKFTDKQLEEAIKKFNVGGLVNASKRESFSHIMPAM